MSILSEYYASYMSHFHKFEERLATFKEAFDHTYSLIYSGQYIDCDLENQEKNYPKYPCIYNYFNKTINFNIWKIYNVAPDNVNVLLDYITNKDVLTLKKELDDIPTDLVKLRNDVYLQYSFYSDYNDLFDTKLHFHDYSSMKNIINYHNSLDSISYNEGFNDSDMSFIHLFLFDFLFRQKLKNMTTFPMALNTYCIRNNMFNKEEIKDSFSQFIKTEKRSFFSLAAKIILQSLYKMTKIDSKITDEISVSIEDKYSDSLISAFSSYIENDVSFPISSLNQYVLNSLYLVFGSNQISQIYNNPDIFTLGFIANNSRSEEQIFNNFKNNLTTTDIKNYLYLSYLYKFWPIKFLNVTPIIISKYVEQQIKPDSSLAFSQKSLESLLSFSLASNNINYQNLTNHFNDNVTLEYLQTLTQDEKVIEFSFFIYFAKLFDDFMQSDEYSDFVNEMYQDVFIILRDKGHVDHSFNWNSCHVLFDLFFKTFIRSKIVDNNIFSSNIQAYSDAYYMVLLNNTGDPSYNTTINFDVDRIKSLYGNLINAHFDKIHYFIESVYLSGLTYTINTDMLSYFLK